MSEFDTEEITYEELLKQSKTVLYLEPDKIISYSDEEYLLEIKDECEEISYEERLRQNKKVIL